MNLLGKSVRQTWLSFLLLVILAIEVRAKADLHAFFAGPGSPQRFFPHRNNNNGCKDHIEDLEASYKQAAEVCQTADFISFDVADLR